MENAADMITVVHVHATVLISFGASSLAACSFWAASVPSVRWLILVFANFRAGTLLAKRMSRSA